MALHSAQSSWATARNAVTGLAMLGLTVLNAFPAAAQQALSPKQCSDAISIADAIVQANKGKISPDLINSFVKFGESKCDMNTDWKLMNKIDEQIFGQFRVRLIALRTAAVSRPGVLANQ